jgi:hypothetical protein
MRYKALLSIGLGLGLALGSSVVLAQDAPVTDTLTKPLGGTDDASKSGDKSKPSTSSRGTATDGGQKASFGALDINTDRKLSRDEVKANTTLSTDFDKLDADRNGSLSDGEFAKFEGGASDKEGNSDSKAEKKGKEAEDKAKKSSRDAERKFDDATDTK